MVAPTELEDVVRARLRGLRVALGWSLDELAERAHMSASTLSRVETGKRTISLDLLQTLANALQTDVGALLDVTEHDDDVIIKPVPSTASGRTVWMLTRPDSGRDLIAAKWRIEPDDGPPDPQVHPGHDWFFVLSGAVRLILGDRELIVRQGEAAEFSTMIAHSITALGEPAEILTIFDRTGHRAHLAKPPAR